MSLSLMEAVCLRREFLSKGFLIFKYCERSSSWLSSLQVAVSKFAVSPVLLNLSIYGKCGYVCPIYPSSFLDIFDPRGTWILSGSSSGDLLLFLCLVELDLFEFERFSDQSDRISIVQKVLSLLVTERWRFDLSKHVVFKGCVLAISLSLERSLGLFFNSLGFTQAGLQASNRQSILLFSFMISS